MGSETILTHQQCRICMETLPISHFYKDTRIKKNGGHFRRCKKCIKEVHYLGLPKRIVKERVAYEKLECILHKQFIKLFQSYQYE